MATTLLTKEGRLLLRHWDPDTKSYLTHDVTAKAPKFLFVPCELEDGVILEHLFRIVSQNIELYEEIIGLWCREFIKEAFSSETPITDASAFETDSNELEYLELHWNIAPYYVEERDLRLALCGFQFPEFSGMGPILEKKLHGKNPGERVVYGVDFTSTKKLKHLPLKINNKARISLHANQEDAQTIEMESPTLGQIIHGIFWELSFFGGPSARDSKAKEFDLILENIDEELKNAKPWDEIKKNIQDGLNDKTD